MTTEQQIKQAIKEVSPQTRVSGYNIGWRGGFLAGASFYREQILPGMMEKLLAWTLVNGYETNDKRSWIKIGKSRSAIYTTTELVTLFLSHLKQKDNGDKIN